MFGRGRRKTRMTQVIEVESAPDASIACAAVEAEASIKPVAMADDLAGFTRTQVSLDATFLAMVAQLDDSLAAMARACDRIEEAVAGATRHQPHVHVGSATAA